MARSTKSSKGSGKKAESTTEAKQAQDATETTDSTAGESLEASDDGAPVVIEGEAVDVSDAAKTDETVTVENAMDDRIAGAAAETHDAKPVERDTTGAPGAVHVDTEPDATTEPTPAAAMVAPPPPQPVKGGGSFFGTVLGGLIAGAIGFLIATYGAPRGWLSFAGVEPQAETGSFASTEDMAAQSGRIDSLEQSIDSLTDSIDGLSAETGEAAGIDFTPIESRIDTLAADLEALRNMPAPVIDAEGGEVDLTPLQTALADLGTRIDGLDTRVNESLTGLDQRLSTLEEAAASTEGSDAMAEQLAAFQQEMDEVAAEARSKIDEAQARAAEIEAAAAEAEARAAQAAALAEVKAAIDSGAGFSEALQTLDTVPDALAAKAEDGVATLSDLQRAFPAAARAALAESQSVPDQASGGSRLVAFLKKQTNARSLAPREGNDADAVLSRAEAALGSGDLPAAMNELSALPDDAKTAMSDWLALAEERMAAVDAVQTLSDELN